MKLKRNWEKLLSDGQICEKHGLSARARNAPLVRQVIERLTRLGDPYLRISVNEAGEIVRGQRPPPTRSELESVRRALRGRDRALVVSVKWLIGGWRFCKTAALEITALLVSPARLEGSTL